MAHQVFQHFQIAINRDFPFFKFFQVLAPEKTLISPLAAGVAAEIAKIGDAEADFANTPGPAIFGGREKMIKEPFFPLHKDEIAINPGVAGQAVDVFQHHSQGHPAMFAH